MKDEQRQRNRVSSCKLTLNEKQAIRDWLDDLIEDQLEASDEFKAKVERANRKSPPASTRVRKPEAGR